MSHPNAHVLKFDGTSGVLIPEVLQTEDDNKVVVVWTPPTPPAAGDTYRIAVTGNAVDFPVSVGTVIGTKVVWVSGVVKAVPGKAILEMKHVGGPFCTVELKLEPVKKGMSNTTIAVISIVLVAVFCLGCGLAGLAGAREAWNHWFSTPDPVVVTVPPGPVPEETKPDPKPEETPAPVPTPAHVQLSCTPDLRVCGEKTRTQDGFVCCRHPDLDDYGPSLYRVKAKVKKDGVWRYGELEPVKLGVTVHTPDAPAP